MKETFEAKSQDLNNKFKCENSCEEKVQLLQQLLFLQIYWVLIKRKNQGVYDDACHHEKFEYIVILQFVSISIDLTFLFSAEQFLFLINITLPFLLLLSDVL
jgi:hypothetical protein